MTSFYGCGSTASPGVGGVSDYNELLNQPIKNLAGTDDLPLNLGELDNGYFMIEGPVQLDKDTETKDLKNPLFINVSITNEGQKVVSYKDVTGKDPIEYYIYYNADGTIDTIKAIGIHKEPEEIVLPDSGEEGVLYFFKSGIYIWNGEEFVLMLDHDCKCETDEGDPYDGKYTFIDVDAALAGLG